MNCNETKFVMPLYLSSELDATRMADFEIHVQQCGACARELEYARHCDELLRDELDPDFLPPRLDEPGEFEIRAARCFDIPLSFSASYCFSFLTLARLFGI